MARIHDGHYVGILFQSIVFILSCIALFLIFYPRFTHFYSYDPKPQFTQWTDDELKNREKVTVGLYIQTFTEFNIGKDTFVVDATVWFKFDENKIPLDKIKKFSVVDGQLLFVGDPIVSKLNGATFARFNTKIKFKAKLNYRMFPMDDHLIRIVITNHYLPKNFALVSSNDDFALGKEFALPGWRVINQKVETGYVIVPYAHKLGYAIEHVGAVFSLGCSRTDAIMITSMLMTFMVIIFLVSSIFSTQVGGLDVLSSGLLALISYLFVLESQSPPHVGYFMLTNFLFTLCLISVILCMLASLYTHHYDIKTLAKKIIIIGVYLFFVGGCFLSSFVI